MTVELVDRRKDVLEILHAVQTTPRNHAKRYLNRNCYRTQGQGNQIYSLAKPLLPVDFVLAVSRWIF